MPGILKENKMGLFDKMKAKVGIGGIKLEIILDEEEAAYDQGDSITGKLKISGGNTEQTIDRLFLQLRMRWREVEEEVIEYADGRREIADEDVETGSETLDEIAQDEPIKVTAGYENEFDFEFNLPYEADITMENELNYFLYARADIPGAIDAKKSVDIKVHPSYEIQQIERVLEEQFFFEFQGEFSQEGWIMAEFFPTRRKFSRAPELIGLSMIGGDEGVEVEIYPDLQAMNFAEFIRSNYGQDATKYQIFLPYERIVPDGEEADLNVISQTLEKVFTDLNWL